MAALTVLNAAQGGADPVTDAAEVAAGAGLEVAAGASITGLGELALGGALSGFGSDVFSQLGADLLDRTSPRFDQTGDDVVPVFDAGEAASSALNGALAEVDGGFRGAGVAVDDSARPFSQAELRVSQFLSGEGHTVVSVAESAVPGQRMYDALVDGQPTELKTLTGPPGGSATNVTVRSALKNANGQFGTSPVGRAANAVLDGRKSGLIEVEAQRGLQRWLGAGRNRLTAIRIIGAGWEVSWP